MSVWKKLESKVLANGVDMELLQKMLKEDLNVTLNFDEKHIKNYWGSEEVDCVIYHNNKKTALGFNISEQGGIDLIGDIYGSGLGSDGGQETLLNKIAQFYQKYNIKTKLEANGWEIENIDVNADGEIVIDAMQW